MVGQSNDDTTIRQKGNASGAARKPFTGLELKRLLLGVQTQNFVTLQYASE